MPDWNGTTVDDLIAWLNSNAGGRAGVSAANGVIALFDPETGEPMTELSVDSKLSNKRVDVAFRGEKAAEVCEAFRIDLLDGGLDQAIEGRLKNLGHHAEIAEYDSNSNTQYFDT